jgi:hypothetical protein
MPARAFDLDELLHWIGVCHSPNKLLQNLGALTP